MDEKPVEPGKDFAVSPGEPNTCDLIAGMLEFAAAAVMCLGYYRHFFPPAHVRWYGGMELIAPIFVSLLLVCAAVVVAMGSRLRMIHRVVCVAIVLFSFAAVLTDFL
jgi:hypothetical protein